MAIVTRMQSDITGDEADEKEFIQLVVREHGSVDDARVLDVLPKEVEKLKTLTDLVVCEVRDNGNSREVVMTLSEFRKLVPDEVVTRARKTRGRRPGFSPAAKTD